MSRGSESASRAVELIGAVARDFDMSIQVHFQPRERFILNHYQLINCILCGVAEVTSSAVVALSINRGDMSDLPPS